MNESKNNTDASFLRKEIISIGKHSMIYVVGQALSRAVGFFMIPVYTRFIAPTNYGAMELIGILTGAILIFVSMGVADSMSRLYYAEKDQTKQNEVISTVVIGFSLIGFTIVMVFLLFSEFISKIILEDSQYKYYLQVSIISVAPAMLCEIGYTYLRMLYRAKLFVTITMSSLVVALSLNIYFVVFLKLDILGIFYSTLITQGLTGLLLTIIILKEVGFRISAYLLKNLIAFGLPLVPSRIGLMLGFVSNRFFLRWLVSPDPAVALAQIGLFSLGHKFGVVINRFVTVPLNSFWKPRRIELLLSEGKEEKFTVARVCTYATMCTIYLSLLLSAGIESLIEIMATSNYKGAHVVVPFVALSYVVLGLETHFMAGMLYRKKTKWAMYITFCSLPVILAWNFIFIPKWGLIGAATSNISGLLIRLTLIYILSQRLYYIPFELGRIFSMFCLALILYIFSQFISFSSPYITFLARTVFVALFPFFLFIVGFYKKSELNFVLDFIRKSKKPIKSLT
jgi:O-antigen/teichoic acid export membrane protein